MQPVFKTALIVVVLIFMAFIVVFSQKAIDKNHEIHFVDNRPLFLPKGEVLKWMSMGYRGLMADWLWIRTVLYYGRRMKDDENPYYVYAEKTGQLDKELESVPVRPSEIDTTTIIHGELRHLLIRGTNRGLVDYVYPMLDRVTTVDPHFIFPYIFGGVYVMMDTGEIEAGLRLLEKGRKANPEHWEFPFYLGWLEWMYRGDMAKTYQLLLEAVEKEGCPPFVGNLLTGVAKDIGRTGFTRLYLEGLARSTENPDVKERIESALKQLRGVRERSPQ